jgi:4-alpha-glucanotransferase
MDGHGRCFRNRSVSRTPAITSGRKPQDMKNSTRFPRASGVLLHPTSLPGPHGSGDFGAAAYHFVDWLVVAKQQLWQILPLGGIGPGNSPYMSSSAFAGNVLLIDLVDLQYRGWLVPEDLVPDAGFDNSRVNFPTTVPWRMERLGLAAHRFRQSGGRADRADFEAFCQQHSSWLMDYALFMALAEHHNWIDWSEWPPALAARDLDALRLAGQMHASRVMFWQFCQWCFFKQWLKLKAYANARNIKIVGDAPIFIAFQSAEVWSRQSLFQLDAAGRPTVVAGVPPDAFSATGQRWGNPIYAWAEHAKDDYAWWIERIRRTFELVDIVRIDHFRGFVDYWEIPVEEPTAMKGRWQPGPGAPLFDAIRNALGPLPIIAEDLGIITPAVDDLRQAFSFPGMRILHFAFGGASANPYLPHNYDPDTVVYTGTHDNNTTLGWWHEASNEERHHVQCYFVTDGQTIHADLVRAACASVADTAIHPFQDILGLDGAHRMNFPGKENGYWEWRFTWSMVQAHHADQLAQWCQLYGRHGLIPETID